MSQHVISIREITVIALTMAKRTDFSDRPSFGHGKRYPTGLSDADKCW